MQQLARQICFFRVGRHLRLRGPTFSQLGQQETLSGPDGHETGQGPHGHLFGDWGGVRTRLEERGVKFDFEYVSDSLWNLKSEQQERFASWNRFRGTVDIDFGQLIGQQKLGGGNLGTYLGLLTSPSGMSGANICRLDCWRIENRGLDERITASAITRCSQRECDSTRGCRTHATTAAPDPVLRERERRRAARGCFWIRTKVEFSETSAAVKTHRAGENCS
jgi:hypothetical protein